MPSSAFSRAAWVPLPEPGAPSSTMRIQILVARRLGGRRRNMPDEAYANGWAAPESNAATHARSHDECFQEAIGKTAVCQSGGVTAVINATAAAVIETCRKHKVTAYAARNGIL